MAAPPLLYSKRQSFGHTLQKQNAATPMWPVKPPLESPPQPPSPESPNSPAPDESPKPLQIPANLKEIPVDEVLASQSRGQLGGEIDCVPLAFATVLILVLWILAFCSHLLAQSNYSTKPTVVTLPDEVSRFIETASSESYVNATNDTQRQIERLLKIVQQDESNTMSSSQ